MTKWHAVCRSCGRVIRSFSAKGRRSEVIFQWRIVPIVSFLTVRHT